jgi:hypothetical protein
MVYTAIAVIVTDFLTGVLTAIVLYAVLRRFLDSPEQHPDTSAPSLEEVAASYGHTAAQYDHPNGEPAPVAGAVGTSEPVRHN